MVLDWRVKIAPGADLSADPATWPFVDVTDRVRTEHRVRISRGRPDEARRVDPSKCALVFDNGNGDFSTRNPLSPFYGLLGTRTPLMVELDPGTGAVERYHGFVPAWPPRSTLSGHNRHVPVTAKGPLDRLNEDADPLRSPIRRAVEAAGVLAYWPLEDGSDADQLASAIPGHPAAKILFPDMNTAADDTLAGSLPLPRIGEGDDPAAFVVSIPPVGLTTNWGVEFLVNVSADPVINTLLCEIRTTGTAPRWQLQVADLDGDDLQLSLFDADDTLIDGTGAIIPNFYGRWWRIRIHAAQVAGTLRFGFSYREVGATTNFNAVDIGFAGSIGRPTSALLAAAWSAATVSVGHIGVVPFSGVVSVGHWDADNGHTGEAAHERIARLCAEEAVEFTTAATQSEAMGPQPVGKFVDLLHEAADTDQGVLLEHRWGLRYLSRAERYNRVPTLTLAAAQLGGEAPEPTDDTQQLRNDITLQRRRGSSARAADPASINRHGRKRAEPTVNPATDAVLAAHAAWRLSLGTVDEMRWPRLDLQLAATPDLVAAWLASDLQSRMIVTDPDDQPYDIDAIIEGYTETLGESTWDVAANTSPASPWTIATVQGTGEAKARAGSANSTLQGAHDSTTATLSVAAGKPWTTTATFPADFPFDIDVGGERMTVGSIVGASSPQTFTVTRSVNGIVKDHDDGTPVRLWRPAVVGL